MKRINQAVAVTGGSFGLQYEFTYTLLAGFAAFISFVTVRQSIAFAYYFYFFNRAAAKDEVRGVFDSEEKSKDHRFSFKTLITLHYVNFFAPLLVIIFYIDDVFGGMLAEYASLDRQTWHTIRMILILGLVSLRMLIFREELQFAFDQSYYTI